MSVVVRIARSRAFTGVRLYIDIHSHRTTPNLPTAAMLLNDGGAADFQGLQRRVMHFLRASVSFFPPLFFFFLVLSINFYHFTDFVCNVTVILIDCDIYRQKKKSTVFKFY